MHTFLTALVSWWHAQALWVRLPLTVGFVALIECWLIVAWLYRPRRRPRALTWEPARPSPDAVRLAEMTRAGLTFDGHTDEQTRWDRLDAAGWKPGGEWAGATEDWSPEADTLDAGQSDDMTDAAVERARLIEAEVRLDVEARLDAADALAELTIAESRTDWALATIDLDRRLDRTVAAFTARTGRILSSWPDTAQWPVVVPMPARPMRPATGKRARRDRKRIHQGKTVPA